jgi:hypothetical protein
VPHPEWVEPAWTQADHALCYAAGVPGQLRLIFVPTRVRLQTVRELEPGVVYRAYWFNVTDSQETDIGLVSPDGQGVWQVPYAPILQDWVLVLEAEGARA